MEHKGFFAAFVDRDAGQIAGHQVRGELHPRELQAKGAGQGMGQRGFANPRHVVDQQVTTGQQAGHAILDLCGFAHNHRVKLVEQGFEFVLSVHGRTLPENFDL